MRALLVPTSLALALGAACAPGQEYCQLQGACVKLGDVTYDNCCAVGGDCTFRFTDGHTVGPFDPNSLEESQAALDEAMAYCVPEDADAGTVDGGNAPVDAGFADAGPPPVADDAGTTTPADAGDVDGGTLDGGAATDAGAARDAGFADAGDAGGSE